jgi:hypothetical protein
VFGRRHQEDREFMRQLVLRMERSERLIVAELAETRHELSGAMIEVKNELAETRRELSAAMTEIKNELVEHRADQRASREALFRILDRLGPGGATT